MKVFPDTNILISAFSARAGLSADIFRILLSSHELLIGEQVLTEFRRVMSEKMKLPTDMIAEIESFLRNYPVFSEPETISCPSSRDPDDDRILQCAINAGADVLLTGDQDLLSIRDQVFNIKILNPREFWELIRQGQVQ